MNQFREALRGSSFELFSDLYYDLISEIQCRYFLYAEDHDLSDKKMLPNEERMKTNFVIYNYVECLKKELEICDALDILLKDKGKCVVRGLTNKTNIAEDSIIPLLKRRFYEREILTEYEKTNNISLGKEPTIENIAITKKHIENSIRKYTKRGAKEKNYILKDAILPFLSLNRKGLKNNDYRAIYNALDIMGLIDLSLKEQWRKTNSYQPEIAFAKSVVKELLKRYPKELTY